MMERYYSFAGLEIAVSMPEDLMYENDYRLEPFRVEAVERPHVFRFRKVDALTPPEGACLRVQPDFRVYRQGAETVRYIGAVSQAWEPAYIRAAHRGREHEVQLRADIYPGRASCKTVLEVLAAEHLTVQNGGVIFHCSFIDRKGKAVLFTAPSQTGKSTQADLWHQYRAADIINGDRAAIRVEADRILAEGIPFSGSSIHCKNRSLPIEAIVYLAQAPQTTIRKMRGYEAFARLWEGVSVNTWDRQDLELASGTVQRIAETVPVFYMLCTPDEAAVAALEQVLNKQVNL